MWLFPHFMKDSAEAALSHCFYTENGAETQQEGNLTSYYRFVHYSLEAYATVDVIAEAELDIMSVKEPLSMWAIRFSEI